MTAASGPTDSNSSNYNYNYEEEVAACNPASFELLLFKAFEKDERSLEKFASAAKDLCIRADPSLKKNSITLADIEGSQKIPKDLKAKCRNIFLASFPTRSSTAEQQAAKTLIQAQPATKAAPASPNEQSTTKEISSDALDVTLPVIPNYFLKEENKNNPFKGTDLIVFEDNYKGKLPLNGVKESELKEAVALYNDICSGKKFVIDGSQDFIDKVKDNIKLLLTRRLGRELFKTLNQRASLKTIAIESPEKVKARAEAADKRMGRPITDYGIHKETVGSTMLSSNEAFVCLPEPADTKAFYHHLTLKHEGSKVYREKTLLWRPSFITLGHELMHIMHEHGIAGLSIKPNLGEQSQEFDNIFEQEVITGLKERLPQPSDKENDALFELGDEELAKSFNEDEPKIKYSEINENNLRAAFGLRYRMGHIGIEDIKMDESDIKSDQIRDEIVNNTCSLMEDAPSDFMTFIKNHKYLLNKTTSDGICFPDFLLVAAINFDNVDLIKFVMTECKGKIKDSIAFRIILEKHSVKALKFLIEERNLDPKFIDEDDKTEMMELLKTEGITFSH